MSSIIKVENVTMRFNLAAEKTETLKEYTIKKIKNKIKIQEFYALQNVTFQVQQGDAFAIVGRNGSGKSTMLKLISGIFKPTYGNISIQGRVAPMIELGAGFDYQLTASENIYLNGAVLGYNRKFMQTKYDEILDFAELKNFEHVPVKNFSSGMKARLGFSIATVVKPDILIVDEVLSVGDFAFRQKCQERLQHLLSGGTTLLLVSHSQEQVRALCKNAIWLDKGKIVAQGEVNSVCDDYHSKKDKEKEE